MNVNLRRRPVLAKTRQQQQRRRRKESPRTMAALHCSLLMMSANMLMVVRGAFVPVSHQHRVITDLRRGPSPTITTGKGCSTVLFDQPYEEPPLSVPMETLERNRRAGKGRSWRRGLVRRLTRRQGRGARVDGSGVIGSHHGEEMMMGALAAGVAPSVTETSLSTKKKKKKTENQYDHHTTAAYDQTREGHHDDFVCRDWESMSPEFVLPTFAFDEDDTCESNDEIPELLMVPKELQSLPMDFITDKTDTEQDDSKSDPERGATGKATASARMAMPWRLVGKQLKATAAAADRYAPLAQWVKNWLTNQLENRWTTETPQNLTVNVDPSSTNVVKTLVQDKHYLVERARVDFERLVFPAIRMHSGSMEARNVALNAASLVNKNCDRWKQNFDFVLSNVTMTQDDWLESRCVVNGLKRLLIRFMHQPQWQRKLLETEWAGRSFIEELLSSRSLKLDDVDLVDLSILPNGKLSATAAVTTTIMPVVTMEFRTWLVPRNRGHVLHLNGLEIVWNGFQIPWPSSSSLSLDLGHNARLHQLDFNPDAQSLTISAKVTVTPTKTLRPQHQPNSAESYFADFFYDVGQWLTELGNFTARSSTLTNDA